MKILARFPSLEQHPERDETALVDVPFLDAMAGKIQNLSEALENAPLIYDIDLVREERALNPRLREKIGSEGVTVYQTPAFL